MSVADSMRAAIAAHRRGRLAEADALYGEVLRVEPAHAEALRLKGILARDRGAVDLSARLLRRAVEAAPDDAETASELGISYLAAGYLQLAESAFRRALGNDPFSLKALANLGAVLQYRGHLVEAIGCHRRALALAPDDTEIRCNLANTLADAGAGEEALGACAAGLARAPGHPLLLAAQGAVLVALDRYPEAVEVLECSLAVDPSDDMALINLALAHAQSGDTARSLEVLHRAVRLNPDNARATADLVNLLAGTGDAAAGVSLAQSFLARHPGERLVVAALAYALGDAGRTVEAAELVDVGRLAQVVDLDEAPRGFANMAAFNAALVRALREEPSLLASPRSKSTRGGAQTGELDLATNPVYAAFAELVGRRFAAWVSELERTGLAGHPAMAPRAPRWTLRAWGTLLGPGGRQIPHMHPLAWYSGVYYVQLPAGMGGGDPQAGWLEFGRPPDRYKVLAPPPVTAVEPRPGRLVLFPSYFHHCTRPFRATDAVTDPAAGAAAGTAADERISLAFDVMPDLTKS